MANCRVVAESALMHCTRLPKRTPGGVPCWLDLLRFFMYLLIGLGSWLGGAVVERLLDTTTNVRFVEN